MRIFCANFERAIQYCTKKDQLNCNLRCSRKCHWKILQEQIYSPAYPSPTEEIPNLLEMLFNLITDLEQQFSEFSEAVTELFDRLYSDKSQDSLLRNQSNEIVDFLQVISWIGSGCSRLNKRFKQPADVLEFYNSLMDLQKKHDQCNSEEFDEKDRYSPKKVSGSNGWGGL
ncbi:hypothetical protein BY996DRAFT_6554729 [Phakopsora pachyrhizi]|nr:hypothetical protein BY996DRAFT_6554729 [Phakopsora pachyrhizi]